MGKGACIRLSSDSSQAREDVKNFARSATSDMELVNLAFKGASFAISGVALGINTFTDATGAGRAGITGLTTLIKALGARFFFVAGASSLATTVLLANYNKLNSALAQIGRNAEAAGLATATFQSIDRRGIRLGEDIETLGRALETAKKRFFDAERGAGTFNNQLKDIAPNIVASVNAQETQTEKLDAFMVALSEYDNEMDRAVIAQAAFGEGGLNLVKVLASEAGGLDGLAAAYRDTGTIITDETIRLATTLEREWEDFMNKIDAQLDGLERRFQTGILHLLDKVTVNDEEEFEDTAKRLNAGIQRNIGLLRDQKADLDRLMSQGADRMVIQNAQAVVRTTEARLDALIEKDGVNREKWEMFFEDLDRPDPKSKLLDTEDKTEDGAKAAAARARLEQEAARYLIEQNDVTLALKLETEAINRLKEAGFLSDQQSAAAISAAGVALNAQTPAMKANLQAQTDLERKAAEYTKQVQSATEQMERQAAAARRQRNAFAEQFVSSVETPGEARLREMRALRDLQQQSARGEIDVKITAEAIARRATQIEEQYQRASEEASRFRDTQYGVEDALYALSTPADDFSEAWRRAALSFVNDFLNVEDTITGIARQLRGLVETGTGGSGFFGKILGTAGSALPGFGSVGTPPIVGEFHSGGRVGSPYKFRDLSNGLRPDESLIVAQNDEIVSRPGQGGSRPISMIFNAPGADREGLMALKAEVSQLRRSLQAANAGFGDRVEDTLSRIQSERGRLT